MGLFFAAPRKPTAPSSGGESFSESGHHISSRELRDQVRRDLHDKLGRTKGESVYGILGAHLDKDRGFSRSVSGREIEGMLDTLKENHRDNLEGRDLVHIEEILKKHFND